VAEQPNPQQLLAHYLDGRIQLARLVSHRSEAILNLALQPNTWTIRQLVHHTADGDSLWTIPIKIALAQHPPVFDLKWYWTVPQDQWAGYWHYGERAIAPSIAMMTANRQHIAAILEHVQEWWQRSIAIDWPNGKQSALTIADIIQMQGDHVFGHIEEIERICQTQEM